MKKRSNGRSHNETRPISFQRAVSPYAEGSCRVRFGNTEVLCTASVSEGIPRWLRGQNQGWLSAEYAMLPRSTHQRKRRDGVGGGVSGRSMEIQRLIGRSLRAVTDLTALGERQITIDCDVIVADGGTRTAAISGSWLALHDAVTWLKRNRKISQWALNDHVAAVSCGVLEGRAVIDLDYAEDSNADVDSNFVMNGSGEFVEIQGTAERGTFDGAALMEMIDLAKSGVADIIKMQRDAIADSQ